MRKKEKKVKIYRMSTYLVLFVVMILVLSVYKNDLQTGGTDDISVVIAEAEQAKNDDKIEITDDNGQTHIIGGGVEVINPEDVEDFYTFEKSYDIVVDTAETKDDPSLAETYYTIKKGDTILKIANKVGQNIDVLVANNPQLSSGKLKLGDKIKILSQNGIYYTIKRGDTLGGIAIRYKVKTSDIAKVNSVTEKNLRIGKEIFIPNPNFDFIKKEKELQLAKKKLKEKKLKELKLAKKKLKEREKALARNREKIDITDSGMFLWPVSSSRINSPFGRRYHPVSHKYIDHDGVDIKASIGTPVHAPDDGKVIFAGWKSGYGKLIIISHADGYSTRFGHLSSIGVSVGDYINKGDYIADTGNTGISTGPHLHYEIRKNGDPLNPMRFR